MSKIVAVPEDLYNKAAEVAARDRVSIEEFISAAVANRLASREYIESKAKLFSREDFERALNEIPDVEPEERSVVAALLRRGKWCAMREAVS